jgi:uncharacterized protein YjiS (DUF1127 family)
MGKFSDMISGLAGRIEASRFRAAMSRLSDSQLADIGLSRDNLTPAALRDAQKRFTR